MDMISRYREMNHFGRHLDMDFVVMEPGIVSYTMKVTEKLLATTTAAHGGAIAGLMDAILGVTALSAVAAEKKLVATIEFKISYFAPALLNDVLTGKGIVLKKGKRIVFTEGEIYNQDKVLIAKGNGTFTAYEAKT